MKWIVVLITLLGAGVARAGPRPNFDPKDVVRQVRARNPVPRPPEPLNPPVDDGEFLIDTTGLHPEWYPALAFDGTNFLVVWEDLRNGADIYGTRVTPGGVVLDPAGIAISVAANYQVVPAVAFDGTNFLVVWQDWRSGSEYDIYGARLSQAGSVLDPSGIAISIAANGQYVPAVAFDGTNFLVVWQDYRSGGEHAIYGARVSQAGIVLDPSGIAISIVASSQLSPAVASDGTNFLVVWMDGRSGYAAIYGARVNQSGIVLDPSGIAISIVASSQLSPAVAFDGTNFLVVWFDYRSGSYTDIYGARLSQAGVVLDSSGIAISVAAEDQYFPAVAFDGANFLVVWEDYRSGSEYDIYGARVTPGGVVFDSGPVVRQEWGQRDPALACGSGGQMLLVYRGWAGTVGGKAYNADRIWGKLDPHPGIAEGRQPTVCSSRPAAAIVRGVLEISSQLTAGSLRPEIGLLDAGGRQVMKLKPGDNDVSGLAPGVYFIRTAQAQAQAQAVRKVIVTR
jgi:hypothetical protein